MRRPADPSLLDVVPWSYGFAHTWALVWLIEEPSTFVRVLDAMIPDGSSPWTLVGKVDRERSIRNVRADLFFTAQDAAGETVEVVVETKVADDLRLEQLEGYRDTGRRVVLYVPGLTGLLMSPGAPYAGETWVTGEQLTDALAGVELPRMIDGYRQAVVAEAARMRDAQAVARGERTEFDRPGQSHWEDLADTAWLVEVAAKLRALDADHLIMRSDRNDRGLFWAGSWRAMPGSEGAGPYVDIVADRYTHRRAVTLKTGGAQPERLDCYDAVQSAGPPTGDDRWRLSRRGTRGGTMSVWRIDVTDESPQTAARHAISARDLGIAVTGAKGVAAAGRDIHQSL